ncbi:MAG: hypothetical protein LBM06_04795 [Prevotellaceae bacterium]|jgi:hypothetical protein|nr:hypothetical protein [Prevotellaceae bacterium]
MKSYFVCFAAFMVTLPFLASCDREADLSLTPDENSSNRLCTVTPQLSGIAAFRSPEGADTRLRKDDDTVEPLAGGSFAFLVYNKDADITAAAPLHIQRCFTDANGNVSRTQGAQIKLASGGYDFYFVSPHSLIPSDGSFRGRLNLTATTDGLGTLGWSKETALVDSLTGLVVKSTLARQSCRVDVTLTRYDHYTEKMTVSGFSLKVGSGVTAGIHTTIPTITAAPSQSLTSPAPTPVYTDNYTYTATYHVLPQGNSPLTYSMTINQNNMASTANKTYSNVATSLKNLQPGYRYPLSVTFRYEGPVFAYSNIFYRDGKLMFFTSEQEAIDAGEPNACYYQGLFFQWGSLVGIAPVKQNNSNPFSPTLSPLYVPDVSNLPGTKSPRYYPTTAASTDYHATPWTGAGGSNMSYLPYESDLNTQQIGSVASSYLTTDRSNDTYYAQYKGDVCRYLTQTGAVKGQWRLPRAQEMQLFASPSPTGTGTNISNSNLTLEDGTYDLSAYRRFTIGISKFPASGFWYGDNSGVSAVGECMYSWTSSPTETAAITDPKVDAGTRAYDFFCDPGYHAANANAEKIFGCTVRCVMDRTPF